jgi:hypothetical protein
LHFKQKEMNLVINSPDHNLSVDASFDYNRKMQSLNE